MRWRSIVLLLLVLYTGLGTGFYAFYAATVVISAQQHPYADSMAPLGLMALLILVGWAPLVVWSWWLVWRGDLVRAAGGLDASTPALAARLNAGLPRWFWTLWRISCWALGPMFALGLWQGFAERSRLPAEPVLGVQLLVVGCWVISSVLAVAVCETQARAMIRASAGGVAGAHGYR